MHRDERSSRTSEFPASPTPVATRRDRASPFSASPQQLRGEPATPADDIYGLGALAYELLSHHPPHYPHFDPRRVQEEPVPELQPAEPIPPRLGALVMRMLEKDAARRPASMSEVIDSSTCALNDTLTFDFESNDASAEHRRRRHGALPGRVVA